MQHRILAPALLLLVTLLAACGRTDSPSEAVGPVIVVGIDGGSWHAIHKLWQQGELPNFRALADRGITTEIKPVAAASPVIWTSIATGVRPERHGITNFVVPTPTGDVPVSSRVRRVPAIWNMASVVDRTVAVLGWWASWPAEEVNGVVVSDRAVRQVDGSFWPPELAATFDEVLSEVRETDDDAVTRNIGIQDRALAGVAVHLADQGYDLLLLYLRNVDVQSHPYWQYFIQPESFPDTDPASRESFGEHVADAYREVDRVLGELLERADSRTNFFVLSDHGFRPVKNERQRIVIDLDRVLQHLGYLERQGNEVDWLASSAATWDSPEAIKLKLVRFGLQNRTPAGPVAPAETEALRERLVADLSRVTYHGGAPAFAVREPKPKERQRGGDLTVIVRQNGATEPLQFDGQPIVGALKGVYELTGTHDANTEGIFMAAGPDIDPAAELDRIHSLDVTPTLLYALGLPVAQDFDGRPRLEIFRGEFRQRHPVHTIPTWGSREAGESPISEADDELMEELRALGYLD